MNELCIKNKFKFNIQNKIKKLFGELPMSWSVVIVASAIIGVVAALILYFTSSANPFYLALASFESWILFAVIIISNCKTPTDAMLKTFVFFLILQIPIIYFNLSYDTLIFDRTSILDWLSFYHSRFIFSLLTLPCAFVGWFIKKKNNWSALLLAAAMLPAAQSGLGFLRSAITVSPTYLLGALFEFSIIAALVVGVLDTKSTRLLACTVCAIAAIVLLSVHYIIGFIYSAVYSLVPYIIGFIDSAVRSLVPYIIGFIDGITSLFR